MSSIVIFMKNKWEKEGVVGGGGEGGQERKKILNSFSLVNGKVTLVSFKLIYKKKIKKNKNICI